MPPISIFIKVAEWASEDDFTRATSNPDWQAHIRRLTDDPTAHLTSHPATYRLHTDISPTKSLSRRREGTR